MDPKDPQIILPASAIAIFLFKEVWTWVKDSGKDLKKSVDLLTLAVTELRVRLEFIQKDIEGLPKLKSDIDHAHHAIRQMKNDNL